MAYLKVTNPKILGIFKDIYGKWCLVTTLGLPAGQPTDIYYVDGDYKSATMVTFGSAQGITAYPDTLKAGKNYLFRDYTGLTSLTVGSDLYSKIYAGERSNYVCSPAFRVKSSYTVTFNAQGGSVSPSSKTVYLNTNFEAPIPTRQGYSFKGWYFYPPSEEANWCRTWAYDDMYRWPIESRPEETSVWGDYTLYARWGANSIHLWTNGGTNNPGDPYTTEGQQVTLPTDKPTRSGYRFVGWDENPNTTTPKYSAGSSYWFTDDVNLYAIWDYIYTPNIPYITVTGKGKGSTNITVTSSGSTNYNAVSKTLKVTVI